MTVKDKRRIVELETELTRLRHYLCAVTHMLSPEKPRLSYRPPGFADTIETVVKQADAIRGDEIVENEDTVKIYGEMMMIKPE